MSDPRSAEESTGSYLRTDLVHEAPGLVGKGLFARAPIPRGCVIGCLTAGTAVALPLDEHGQVDYGRFASAQTIDLVVEQDRLICLVKQHGPDGPSGADLINHSCTPNCEVVSRLVIVALRDIEPGEELLVDYLAGQITLIKEGIACLCRPGCTTVI